MKAKNLHYLVLLNHLNRIFKTEDLNLQLPLDLMQK